jgi:hypothetical protein
LTQVIERNSEIASAVHPVFNRDGCHTLNG